MYGRTINKFGEIEIDPLNRKAEHENWLKKIGFESSKVDYYFFKDISKNASKEITKYILDLHNGKNLAKGTGRGRRSYNHMANSRTRLHNLARILEKRCKKEMFKLTENDILSVFNAMRDGSLRNKYDKPHLCVAGYAKGFAAFWKWYMRTQKLEGKKVENIVENLDTSADRKPKWSYFTLQDVEKMAGYAPNFYYKTLIYFLFDSGIRAPRELMNVRAMDISPVPNSNYLFLNIRDETSKTFGRKIKLMICSDLLKKFIEQYNRKGQDFLFPTTYIPTRRAVALMAYKALKIGEPYRGTGRKTFLRNGVTLYDFRHNSVCHYLPIYQSENQMKYRYGWKSAEMIHYYSEFMGMKDTITDEDMLIDTTKVEIHQALQKEQHKVAMLQEQMQLQKEAMDEKMQEFEKRLLQKFADELSSKNI